MHCPPRWFRLFCFTNASTCSFVIELICSSICERLSSGKLSSWVRRCSFIFVASSSVITMINNRCYEL